jgi:tetratricopeptide (TPR) repeat protein/predicted Ser/Thr protein kinase
MGEVFLAHDDRLDRLVAIKRLHDDHAATPDRRERFRREARIAARLNHPAIVQIHDVLQQGALDYLIMEYIEGRTLRERCDAGPMSVSEVLGIAHQIALGMVAAHDLGVIHRDLKAENILITPAGRAKITDFGIAKLRGEDTLTAKGAVLGTFRAMSPEQALGRAIDHRSDLFSFGILLYEALAGVSPFRADTPFMTVQRLVMDDPRPITELVPSIPSSLASLIHQLLAKEPLLRPRDFHEVADALIELAGQACDAPCHAGSAPGGGLPSRGDDTESTGDSPAPVRPRPASDPAAAAPAIPPGKMLSALADAGDGASARPRVPPRRRLKYAAAVGLAVGALGIGYVVRERGRSGASPRTPLIRVAVLPPDYADATGHPDIAQLASAVRDAVMAGVQARVGLELVHRRDIDIYVDGFKQTNRSQPKQREIQAAVDADEVIATRIECSSDSCKVTLERDTNASGSPPPEWFQLAGDSATYPRDTVAAHVRRLYAPPAGSLAPRDQQRYDGLVQGYWAGGDHALPIDQLLEEIVDIRQRSPRSLDVLLFEAEVLRNRYEQTKDPDDAGRLRELLRNADELLPDTYSILSAQFDLALSANDLKTAHVFLDRLATLDPDNSVTHLQRANLDSKLGKFEQARGELDAAARRDSLSWRVPYYRARMARQLVDHAAAQDAIHQLLERSPDNYAGLSLRAVEELETGRLACAEQDYARLVARAPHYDECLNLGSARSLLGWYPKAVDSFRCALAIRPDDPATLLDLAESLLLAGDTVAAEAQLHTLHEILVRKRGLSSTGVLEGVDLLIEAQALAYLSIDDPALASEARERADKLVTPGARPAAPSADALYTAALVHAVLGDRALAAGYVTKYLDGHDNPAQFGYRWFDYLRRDPVIGPRLVVPPSARSCETAAAP